MTRRVLIPPAYVKPFVKRQKNDAADAEAICEAAQRPNMRFVAIKARCSRLRQWYSVPAICWSESAGVAPKGPSWVTMLRDPTDDEIGLSLPQAARGMFRVMLALLEELDRQIAVLDKEIARREREDEVLVV